MSGGIKNDSNDKIAPYRYQRTILFGETDAARIVYTPRFTDYCMEAAEVWFREYLDNDWYYVNAHEERGTPVVYMDFDFKTPLRGNDSLVIEVRVSKVGNSTLALAFTGVRDCPGTDESVLSFTANIIFCFFSNETGKAMPIPEKQRQMITNYMLACEQ